LSINIQVGAGQQSILKVQIRRIIPPADEVTAGSTIKYNITIVDSKGIVNINFSLVPIDPALTGNLFYFFNPPTVTPKLNEINATTLTINVDENVKPAHYKLKIIVYGKNATGHIIASAEDIELIIKDKETSEITCHLNSPIIRLGESVQIEGSLRLGGENGRNENITLQYKRNQKWESFMINKTNKYGEYTFTWIPQEKGEYFLRTVWSGSDKFKDAKSSEIKLMVVAAPDILNQIKENITVVLGLIWIGIAIFVLAIRVTPRRQVKRFQTFDMDFIHDKLKSMLNELYEHGILTPEEYIKKRAQIEAGVQGTSINQRSIDERIDNIKKLYEEGFIDEKRYREILKRLRGDIKGS
jgi:uncharacterized protein YqgQ